jgi:LuxR family maltose regulon positive regulatory protein
MQKLRLKLSCISKTVFFYSKNEILKKVVQLCVDLNKETSNYISCEHKFDENPLFVEVTKLPQYSGEDMAKFLCMIYDISLFFTKTLLQAKGSYGLSDREFEILQKSLHGKSNEEIAKELFLSIPTIKKHLAGVYGKMNIKTQKQIFEKLKFL